MCLRKVDKKPMRTPGTGYKLAQRKNSSHYSCDYGINAGKVEYREDRWITDANDYKIRATDGDMYQTGFHVSLSEERMVALAKKNNAGIENLIVIKCRFKCVAASDMEGDSHYGPVVVARKIMNTGEL